MQYAFRTASILMLLLATRLCLAAELGPRDGHSLPPVDRNRVQVGSVAPDFALETNSGQVFSLHSAASGTNLMLVFYRGVW